MLQMDQTDPSRITRVTDGIGRVLSVRRPGVLQKMRLFETVGAENTRNIDYMSFAYLAASVAEIDGEVCEPIATKRQLEAKVQLLGEHGMDAAFRVLTGNAGAIENAE